MKRTGRVTRLQRQRIYKKMQVHHIPSRTRRILLCCGWEPVGGDQGKIDVMEYVGPNFSDT